MSTYPRCLSVVILLLFCYSGMAQKTPDELKATAIPLFEAQKYSQVIPLLNNRRVLKKDDEAKFILAVSLFQTNQLNRAIVLFDQLLAGEKVAYPESWWYKGKILHARNEFSKAVKWYKVYLKSLKDDHPLRPMVRDAIRRCSNGIELRYQESIAIVENLGNEVNTVNDEFAPVVSPNRPNKIYFSSLRPSNMGGLRNEQGIPDERNGKPFADMFSCEQAYGEDWGNTQPMHFLLNSTSHDVLLDFSEDGQVLYYFKGWRLNQGEIYVDTFKQINERTIATTPLITPIRPATGDGMLFMANDTLILFASRSLKGFGGYDLYKIVYANNAWSTPINLGPDINSPFDEITPFLARDLRTLYFSTNNPRWSIGGFDVIKSIFLPGQDRWYPPKNLGLPINSAGDDTYFRLAIDGFTGYLASSRKDGIGQRDLYVAYFKEYLPEMEYAFVPPPKTTPIPAPPKNNPPPNQSPLDNEVLPSSTPVANAKPAEGAFSGFKIDDPTSEEGWNRLNNAAKKLKDQPSLKVIISCYDPVNNDINSTLFNNITRAELIAQQLIQAGVPSINIFTRALANEGSTYSTLSFFGQDDTTSDFPSIEDLRRNALIQDVPVNQDLLYKIQVVSLKGAYDGAILSAYEWPMVEKSPDGNYYRYTVGGFNSYKEAKEFERYIKQNEVKDAYIVPYINGLRVNKQIARSKAKYFPDLNNYLQP